MNHSTDAFEKAYARLNAGQKEAVDTIDGPVMVMAGPGTGKTQVLTLRIANILKQTDVPPDAILALTFTDSGCVAMRERLTSLIGAPAYRVGIHTFHGYASTIIKSHPEFFPRIIGSTPADEVDLYDIVREALARVNTTALLPPGNPEYYVRPVLKLIETLKSDAVDVEGYREYLKKEEGEGAYDMNGEPTSKFLRSGEFVSIFAEYENLLRERSLHDFSDMLIELGNALEEHEELRFELAESAQYILADEHQDANRAQNRILELLSSSVHDIPNLFMVGDDKQAIYRFQGASLENFLYFKGKYPSAHVISLSENYRSTQAILDAASELMQGKSAQEMALVSQNENGKPIEILSLPTEDEEVREVVFQIEELIKGGVPPREIAVLLRRNRDIDSFVRALRARNIPYVSFRDSDALAHPKVTLFLSLIKAVANPHDSEALARALLLPAFNIRTETLSKIFHEHGRTKKPLFEILREIPECAVAYAFFEKVARKGFQSPALLVIDDIVSESGYLSAIMDAEELGDALEAYRAVRSLIATRAERSSTYSLKDCCTLIKHLERGTVSIRFPRSIKGNGVSLMTIHKSKGLEFDYVFIPHAIEARFEARKDRLLFFVPPDVNRPEPDTDDERRLLYVGLTRARKHVTVTHHAFRADETPEAPSQFLFAIENTTRTTKESTEGAAIVPEKESERRAFAGRGEYSRLIEAFLSQGISATALNTYLRDPWECFFKNILRLPETKKAHQMYGSAIHEALERFFGSLTDGAEPNKNSLISYFDNALRKQALLPRESAAYQKKGREALEGYFDAHKDSFKKGTQAEVSVAAELVLPEGSARSSVTLRGFLDKIEFFEGNNVRVVDYKTGVPKSRNDIEGNTKSSDGSYKRQLVFYKLLLDLEGKHTMSEAVIDFIEPNANGKYKRESFVILDTEKEALVEQIVLMVDDLVKGDFMQKTCESEDSQVRALADIVRARFV